MTNRSRARARPRWGLSWPIIAALAALAVPRVVVHDLKIVQEGTWPNTLLVFVPPICWVVVVVARRTASPFQTVLVIGICAAVTTGVVHQVLWPVAMADVETRLGGNLAGLDRDVQHLLFRIAAFVSSVVTGTVVGMVTAATAWAAARLLRRVEAKD